MMVGVFALMVLTLITAQFARRWIATACMLVCLAASAGLFLSDVHNRDYGFGLPWLVVQTDNAPRSVDAAGGRP